MMNSHTPPGFTSMREIVLRKPFGPHHFATCSRSVHASHTTSRGASKTRVAAISRSASTCACSLFAFIVVLLFRFVRFQLPQVFVEPVEALLPESAVRLDPVGDLAERSGVETARAPLRLSRPRGEPGALEHLEVLGCRGEAHRKRRGQLGHRRLAGGDPRENRAPGRVGKGAEDGAERVAGRGLNHPVNYPDG